MVLFVSCHPFSSQRVINPLKEPVKCIISGEWIFVFTVDLVTEVHKLLVSDWSLQSTFKNEGKVEQAVFCQSANFLASLEKSKFGYIVQVYHNLLEDLRHAADDTQEWRSTLSLDFTPTCLDCCSRSGSLAIGGKEFIKVYKLATEELTGRVTFTESMNIHVSYFSIQLLNIHQNFLAIMSTKEVHVLYVPSMNIHESHQLPKQYKEILDAIVLPSVAAEEIYYHRKGDIFELQGPSCFAPRTAVLVQSNEKGASEAAERTLHILYKLLPEEDTSFHTLQLIPSYYSKDQDKDNEVESVVTMHCLLSNTKEGFLYQLYPCVILHSRYLYTSPCASVSLDRHFLFAATEHGLASYTHRVHATFINQLYLTERIKEACPDPTHDICLVSQKPFYGLRSLVTSNNRVLMMSKVGKESKSVSSSCEDAWSIYILDGANPCDIFDDITEFGLHSNQMNPEIYLQGLLETHFLLRSEVIQKLSGATDDQLDEHFKKSCKQLGEFFARESSKENMLTLKYFNMAGVSLDEGWRLCFPSKNSPSTSQPYNTSTGQLNGLFPCIRQTEQGKWGHTVCLKICRILVEWGHVSKDWQEVQAVSRGFLHYLENAVFNAEMCDHVSQECLSSILDIFLTYKPVLCSEVIVAPHLQDEIDITKADEVLAVLRKQVMHGQQHQWKPLDFIAAITVYLRKGEMDQALATFDLIYEDELVNLCCEREHLVVSKDKKQLTYLSEMMSKFPSAIVSVLINLTEVGKMSYLEVCDVIERSIPDGLGQDAIFMQYLEAFIESTSQSCLGFKMVAMEKLLHLYLRHLILETSSQSSPSSSSSLSSSLTEENVKRKRSSTSRVGGVSRYSWLDKLPPFQGNDIKVCSKGIQAKNMHMKNKGLWRFSIGSTPPAKSLMNVKCDCLQCHSKLVKLQDLLCFEFIKTINIQEVMELCLQLPEKSGRLSLQVLCLAVTSPLEATRIILDTYPSIFSEFCSTAIEVNDLESWKEILRVIKEKENDNKGKDIKILQQCTKDVLNYLSSELSSEDFQEILPRDASLEFSAPFLKKLENKEKIENLKDDIIASLEILVNP